MTQTTNFQQLDSAHHDEQFCLQVLEQKGEYIPQWQQVLNQAGERASCGLEIIRGFADGITTWVGAEEGLRAEGIEGGIIPWTQAFANLFIINSKNEG